MSIKTERLNLGSMPSYLALPARPGPHPAVIVLEEIFGVNGHIRDVTERVAREGYVAIAPDYHHRSAPGQELGYDQAGREKGMKLIPLLTEQGILDDLHATIAYLRGRDDVRGDRIGCIGFCIGGHVAYIAAEKTDVRASASFYGGGIATFAPGGGPPTVTKTNEIRGKILCLFGGQDAAIPKAQVETIRQALTDHDVRHELVVYDDAGHGFFCDQRGSYNARAAADAWERVKRLFKEELA